MDWPVAEWEGNCYAAACELTEAGLIQGVPEYGLYHGPVQPGGYFDSQQPIQRHGWIRAENGDVVDPTRWVFEAVDAYIAVIPAGDERQEEYDLAGYRFRKQLCGDSPPPAYAGQGRTFTAEDWDVSDEDSLEESEVFLRLGPPPWDIRQMHWLGNRPPAEFGDGAQEVYAGLIRVGCSAMIPIDFRISVFGRNHDRIVKKLQAKSK